MKKIKLDQLPKNATANSVPVNTTKAAADGTKSAGQWWKILVAILMLVYMISPVDLIPEAVVPVVGLADDVIAAVGMIITTISAIKNRRYDPNARMEQRADDIFGKDNF